MSITVDTASFEVAGSKSTFHFMPCRIDQDGDAKVSSYFTTGIRNTDGVLTASFRGRPLQGQNIQIPEGYTGVVLKEPHKKFNEEDERQVKAIHSFSEFTYWNLDAPPSGNDKVKKMLNWLDISKAVHLPVDDDESAHSTPEK